MRSDVDIVIRTCNSGVTLAECLSSAEEKLHYNKIIVIDHFSEDNTVDIARKFGCEIYFEGLGLGFATSFGIRCSSAKYLLFLDSDVIVKRENFVEDSIALLNDHRVGAVVGMSVGHPFSYGLPLGLTTFRREILEKIYIPGFVGSRETYFIQSFLRERHLKIVYLENAMIHNSLHRRNRYWPEWQGSWVRITAGLNPREVLYSMLVVFLMLLNSKKMRNILYIPIFQAKLLRGFINPDRWSHSLDPITKKGRVDTS
jgi:glycosyltransferase involved in cell wall biosynthesis